MLYSLLGPIPMPMTVPIIINEIAQQSGWQILGQERLASRQAKFLPIPSCLHENVRNLISLSYPDGLYGHQTEAIDAGLKGHNICLATSTASGKSGEPSRTTLGGFENTLKPRSSNAGFICKTDIFNTPMPFAPPANTAILVRIDMMPNHLILCPRSSTISVKRR